MSNEAHEDIIRDNAHRLYSAGELELVDQHYWDDVRVEAPNGSFAGHQGVRNFISQLREAFPDLNLYLRDVFSDKNLVGAEWTFEGTHTGPLEGLDPTGNRVHFRGVSVSLIVKNKIEEERHYWDRSEVFRQLGVRPGA